MKTYLRPALFLLAVAILGVVAFAATADATEQSEEVAVYEGQYASADEFVKDIKLGLATKTAFIRAELCGAIEQNGNHFRIRVVTSKKFQECNYLRPAGAVGLHTHPDVSRNGKFSDHDMTAGPGYLVVGRRVMFHDGNGAITNL